MAFKKSRVAPEVNPMLESQGIKDPGNGNGNGHNGQSRGINTETAGLWGDGSTFENIMKQMDQPSVGRELVHPGKDALDISMRTVLKDRDESKLIMQLMSWCREFDFPEGIEDIKTQMALYNSVGGYARDQFIQAITQTYRGTTYKGEKEYHKSNYRKDDEDKKDNY